MNALPRFRPLTAEGDPPANRRIVLRLHHPEPGNMVAATRSGRPWDVVVQNLGDSSAPTGDGADDVLIIETDPNNSVDFAEFESCARQLAGRMVVMGAVRNLSVANTKAVLRAGAVDVLPLPLGESDISAALEALLDRPPTSHPGRNGKVVALLGAHGGCGATAIATQAATLWAAKEKVCLVDLDIQSGTVALYLDLHPPMNLADVIFAGSRLDADLLASVAASHSTGLDVVCAPAEMPPLDLLTVSSVDKIIDLGRSIYDVVLLHTPRAWFDWSLRAIERADIILLITTPSVTGIHQARRHLATIAENGLSDRVRLVVNRAEQPLIGKPNLKEAERLLGRAIDFVIVNDPETMGAAIDLGKSVAGRSGGRIQRDLRALVDALSGPVSPGETS